METIVTQNEMKYGHCKSEVLLNEVYFWTDTFKDWNKFLEDDFYKRIIINCWRNLIQRNKIRVYGFVIMPNHIHVMWEMMEENGREMPSASFNKFTGHQFLKNLQATQSPYLSAYSKKEDDRDHRFWQRDPLAILMDSKKKAEQKLDYIHYNPLQEHWNIVTKPEEYRWSSARFYETGYDEFEILTDYRERF